MKIKPNLIDRAPAIGHEYNLRLSLFSSAADVEPKMTLSTTGNFRINLLHLVICVASVSAIVASASAAAKMKNEMHK